MIPDITTGQRTYFIGVSSTTRNFDVDVPFKDTAGSAINCNYVHIQACGNSQNNNGGFVAELSGLSRVGNMDLNSLSALRFNTNLNGSGILGIGGVFGGGANGTAVWHGSNAEICNGMRLRVTSDMGSTYFGITYGNLLPYNILRSDLYDKGR